MPGAEYAVSKKQPLVSSGGPSDNVHDSAGLLSEDAEGLVIPAQVMMLILALWFHVGESAHGYVTSHYCCLSATISIASIWLPVHPLLIYP